MWSDKQIFAHRGPLYSSWLHLQRSELIDVIDVRREKAIIFSNIFTLF